MENLILGILALGCGIVTLLAWLWLSAERDLTKSRLEFDSRDSEARKIAEELNNLKQTLLDHEKRLSKSANQEDDVANQHDWLRGDIAELRRKLDEMQLAESKRAQSVAQARGGGDPAELVRLDDRVAELEHGRQRSLESGESAKELAFIEERFDDLLTMQTAFAEAQRRLHDALATFAGSMDNSSKAVIETPTFELFRGSGAQAQPISTGSAPDSGNAQQPTIHSGAEKQSGPMPRLRNLKAPKAG